MAGIAIFLCILTFLLFVFTRNTYVNIKKTELFSVEIHLTFFAIVFTQKKDENKKKTSLSVSAYIEIFKKIIHIIEESNVIVKNVVLPQSINTFDNKTATKTYRNNAIIYAIIAYLRSKSQNLKVSDDAISFTPNDSKTFEFYISFELPLFRIVSSVIPIILNINKAKKKRIGNV